MALPFVFSISVGNRYSQESSQSEDLLHRQSILIHNKQISFILHQITPGGGSQLPGEDVGK